jgi:hypothetical protein
VATTPSRRRVLQSAISGVALTLVPIGFTAEGAEAGASPRTASTTGHLDPGAADWVYLPVQVPPGVNRLSVSYSYSKPAVAAGELTNSCDIGVFDERGVELGGAGFRGWSGGFRTEFEIGADHATPGYLPGPIRAGLWHIILGPYKVSPVGLDYSVTVTLGFGPDPAPFQPAYPPQSVPGSGQRWYRGDSHLHTVYSDGKRLPEQVAAGARAAGLNFIMTTDHNTSSSHGVWGPLAGPDLLIVTGEEITTRNGHVLALGIPPGQFVDWRYRANEDVFAHIADSVRRSGGIVVPAHPYCPYVGCRWKFGYADADAVEVWNGPWTIDDEITVETWDAMLVSYGRHGGRWLPAVGNSDAHSEPQVIGMPQTVVLADTLSRDALLAGITAGRSYLAESSAVQLDLTATAGRRNAGMGARLPADPATQVTVSFTVAGVPNGVTRLITDEGQTVQTSLPAGGSGTLTWTTTPQLSAYVRGEVRHPLADGTPGNGTAMGTTPQLGPMAALTNPVWLGHPR